ncbi:MAG: tetratricopeptide repeat protein, partial [Candidatus Dadabacteria bacterium]
MESQMGLNIKRLRKKVKALEEALGEFHPRVRLWKVVLIKGLLEAGKLKEASEHLFSFRQRKLFNFYEEEIVIKSLGVILCEKWGIKEKAKLLRQEILSTLGIKPIRSTLALRILSEFLRRGWCSRGELDICYDIFFNCVEEAGERERVKVLDAGILLASLAYSLGDGVGAREVLERVIIVGRGLSLSRTARAYFLLGQLCLEDGEYDVALEHFEKSRKGFVDGGGGSSMLLMCYLYLAESYFALGKEEEGLGMVSLVEAGSKKLGREERVFIYLKLGVLFAGFNIERASLYIEEAFSEVR